MISFYLKKFKKFRVEGASSLLWTRAVGVFIQDICMVVLSFQLSLFLRLGDDISHLSTEVILLNTFLYVLFGASAFLGKHIYKSLWPDSAEGGLISLALPATYITLLYLPALFILPPDFSLPPSTPFINWFVLMTLLGTSRLFCHLYEGYQNKVQVIVDPLKNQQGDFLLMKSILKRSPIPFDRKSVQAMIRGKRILVTGAGGEMGKELMRHISEFSPSHLCLVDRSEHLLYLAGREIRDRHPTVACDEILGDVAYRERIRYIISSFRPDLVFHAAALKHSSILEKNLSEAIATNVIGTRNVAEACRDFNVRAMLLISTNRARNPTHIMGATKRLAECYCQALDGLERKKPNGTRYASIQFGTVLESSESVVSQFRQQIAKGGPLKISHSEMIGYFITAQEVGELVLQAMSFALSSKIQAGRIFVLERGEPLKMDDLAREMIRHAGLEPDEDIEIKFTGLKSGWESAEDLPDHLFPTNHPRIFTAMLRTMDHGFLIRALHELEIVAKAGDHESISRLLHALVPEYKKSAELDGASLKMAEVNNIYNV